MSIDRVNIQTASFTLRAVNIRGGQLQNILGALRRAAGAAGMPSSNALGAGQTGPGAMQSPSQRFAQLAVPPTANGANDPASGEASGPSDPTSGFASSGQDKMRSLDSNGFMNLIMQLLERLLQSLFQMLGQQGAQPGDGTTSGQTGGCGGGSGSPGSSQTSGGGGGIPSTTQPGGSSGIPSTTSSGGGSAPVPIRTSTGGGNGAPPLGHGSCGAGSGGRSRARPSGQPSEVRKILGWLGHGARAAAPLVPGGGVARAAIESAVGAGRRPKTHVQPSVDGTRPVPRLPAGRAFPVQTQSSLVSGASVEDRLTQFITSQVRDVEHELDAAMQQGAGGAGGDSRTLVSQRVQQLAQKRSELIETLTNTLKSLHDSSMSVARNVKS